jgi:tryptophan 7-halogenase
MKKQKIIVVGGGTAGIIAATYIKTYWGDKIDVDLIYDHSKPGIGVGESLTPMIHNYLSRVGISVEDLIANVNATIKVGLKFKNWHNDGTSYIHSFNEPFQAVSQTNAGPALDIINNCYDIDYGYGKFWYDEGRIPPTETYKYSVHIDATLFSKYVENRFKDRINIIDDIVEDVITVNGEKIDHLILKKAGKVQGDFYIDASGLSSVLFKKLNNEWIDKTDWLPVNRCIPNPLPWEFKDILPSYTTAEASDQGWILQVPLSNRWGTGYIYCDEFVSEDQAFDNFEKFIRKNYNSPLNNTSKVLSFNSGYWKKQWVGNCIAVGLSSGFAEPLEATNIHHSVYQSIMFVDHYFDGILENDVSVYNQAMSDVYENIYLYIRFCYTTGRTDSKFWQYMTNSTPSKVRNMEDKVKNSILTYKSFQTDHIIFNHGNFTKIAHGLRKIDLEKYKDILISRDLLGFAEQESQIINNTKIFNIGQSVDHLEFIQTIKNLTN